MRLEIKCLSVKYPSTNALILDVINEEATMSNDVIRFKAEIPEGGFHWVSGRVNRELDYLPYRQRLHDTHPYLLQSRFLVHAEKSSPKRRVFHLLEEEGLYKKFASLEVSEESILEFSNRYGLLDTGLHQIISDSGKNLLGEGFEEWAFEISAMSRSLELWELLDRNSITKLRELIKWTGDGNVICLDGREDPLLSAGYLGACINPPLETGDLTRAVKLGLELTINARLSEYTNAKLSLDNSERPVLFFEPTNMLGALWLQFANAIHADMQFRICDHCGKYFGVGLAAKKRSDSIYCSASCRTMASRKRKGEK